MTSPSAADPFGQPFTWMGRPFLRAAMPCGGNKGASFTIAQPLAGRWQIVSFVASQGTSLLLHAQDLRTGCDVLVKGIVYDRLQLGTGNRQPSPKEGEGVAQPLRLPRRLLDMERRLLVLLQNAGCDAVPLVKDLVFDANPLLAEPCGAADGSSSSCDADMLRSEPYLIMDMVQGQSLEEMLRQAPERRLPAARAVRIACQLMPLLAAMHERRTIRPGLTWQMICQDLSPARLLISGMDRVALADLGGCQLINGDGNQILLPGAVSDGYGAPECELSAPLTPAADSHAVGVLLFQMLTGCGPLDLAPVQLVRRPWAGQLVMRPLEDRCPPSLRKLIQRCLDRDPLNRPALAEVRKTLDRLC